MWTQRVSSPAISLAFADELEKRF